MWCNKCHWGSEIHQPFSTASGDMVCNTCGNTGKLGGKDGSFTDKNPVPNDPKSSIHPSRQDKKRKPLRGQEQDSEIEGAAV